MLCALASTAVWILVATWLEVSAAAALLLQSTGQLPQPQRAQHAALAKLPLPAHPPSVPAQPLHLQLPVSSTQSIVASIAGM